uniref:WRKY transcription factor n=1 Tax=Boehmeria nivea TaxID=83906 RepID=A0A7U0F5F1_BOENI|nr:WRKY transcription factor [Boehmeria nivea]
MYMASSNSCSLTENVPSSDLQKAMIIDELVQGRELATQLRALLAGAGESSDSAAEISAGDLVSRIMTSFTNTIILLDRNDAVKDENEAMSSLDARKSEDSEESNCRSALSPARAPKDRRGSYKRRKSSFTQIKDTATEINDGHAWRKYGQKKILKAKHPRNYFRCTHKYDQHCLATKDVQRIQDDPPLFRTTYYGQHTCRSLPSAPELVLDCTIPAHNSSAVLLSFNTANNTDLNNLATKHPFFSPPFNSITPHVVKQEYFGGEILAADIVPYGNSAMNKAQLDQSDPISTDYLRDDDADLRFGQSVLSPNFESDIQEDVLSEGIIGMGSFEDDVLQHLNF